MGLYRDPDDGEIYESDSPDHDDAIFAAIVRQRPEADPVEGTDLPTCARSQARFIIESLLQIAYTSPDDKTRLDALKTLLAYGWGPQSGTASKAGGDEQAAPSAIAPVPRALPLHKMNKRELDAVATLQEFNRRMEEES